jgi:hypothetical protein
MKHETSRHFMSHFLLGLLAIAVGVALLLERSGILEMGFVRHYWPFLLVLFGIGRIIEFPHPETVIKEFWLVFIGLWLYISLEHLWGLSFANTWPMVIIFCGLSLILKNLFRKSNPCCVKED